MDSIDRKIMMVLVVLLLFLLSYGFSSNEIRNESTKTIQANIDPITIKPNTTDHIDFSCCQKKIKIGDVNFRELSQKKQAIIIAWFSNKFDKKIYFDDQN